MSSQHVCPHCGLLHETVPGCRSCDQWGEMRAYWLARGNDRGRIEAFEEMRPTFEELHARLQEFEGDAGRSAARAASGPSHVELEALRKWGV